MRKLEDQIEQLEVLKEKFEASMGEDTAYEAYIEYQNNTAFSKHSAINGKNLMKTHLPIK